MHKSSRKVGTLFVVATPIGNLRDVTYRAVETLKTVDLIAVEDTRHSAKLLQAYAISTPVVAYHEHNEREQARNLVGRIKDGLDIALITDAGTPLLSDPGFRLVQAAHAERIPLVPVPGCCAAIAALSVAGLPTDRFVFEGFLPSTRNARRRKLEQLAQEAGTLVFYESPHRIRATLADLVSIFGPSRMVSLAREMTKQYETILTGELSAVERRILQDSEQTKGEFVLCVGGRQREQKGDEVKVDTAVVLAALMKVMPVSQAASLAAEITGRPKNLLYKQALDLKE